ncbi:hypothetical protein P7C73_g6868, partial [Tremellales sp. Uapishka_1]
MNGRPGSTSSITQPQPQPQPQRNHSQQSIPMASSSSTGVPSRPSSTAPIPRSSTPAPPQPQPQPNHPPPDRSRHTTPPPAPRPKTPPPPSPSHAALSALLRSEGKMSPELARQLASNPALLKLLKAVPASAGPLSALRQEVTADPTAPTSSSTGVSPSNYDTPTPGNTKVDEEGCSNCHTLQSECWLSKRGKKVCNGGLRFRDEWGKGEAHAVCSACGTYFNTYKKMRPKELWGTATSGKEAERTPKANHQPLPHPPAHNLRSSPRINKHESTSYNSANSNSPRKRQRITSQSPRMATRASAKSESSSGGAVPASSSQWDAATQFFSPTTMFATSPPVPAGEMEIEQLLAQIQGDQNGHSQLALDGSNGGFNLESLFGGEGEGMSQELQD